MYCWSRVTMRGMVAEVLTREDAVGRNAYQGAPPERARLQDGARGGGMQDGWRKRREGYDFGSAIPAFLITQMKNTNHMITLVIMSQRCILLARLNLLTSKFAASWRIPDQ